MTKKILLIEDSRIDAELVRAVLEEDGFDIEVAMTGEKGIDLAKKIKPDLIILDLILPDMEGAEVCKRIKADISLAKSIVVVLSIRDNVSDITQMFNARADDYMIKPPDLRFLARKIRLYLGIGSS